MTRFVVVPVCVAAMLPAWGQAPASDGDATSATRKEAILKLISLTKGREALEASIDQMIAMKLASKAPDPRIPEGFWERYREEFSVDEVIRRSIPVYARHFTHEEVLGLIEFYKTPLGQKSVDAMSKLMQEVTLIGAQYGREVGGKVGAELAERKINEQTEEYLRTLRKGEQEGGEGR